MSYKPPYAIPEVLRLRSEGLTRTQIADHFGISGSRVGQIIEGERQRLLCIERSAAIRNEIRSSNEICRKLPIADLFCVLNLPRKPQGVLTAHFDRQGITSFSLLDMMDLLIPVVDAQDYYDRMPAYRVKMLGQILYADMIKALSAVDCGGVFQAEWTVRKARLREYLIGRGGFCPYILQGRNPALSKAG